MSIKGFSVGGVVQRYDYTALDNLPQGQGVSDDLKAALLQLAQKVAYIDDQGQTYYEDLYNALYPEKTLLSITANFQQGQAVVYNTDSLDSLKQYLTVTAIYDDASTETVPSSAYTLSGTLTTGTSVITVTYEGKTDAFNVTVTAAPIALTVTNNLTGCTTSNSATSVLENTSYTAVITASSGYTLVGATVSITMGGQDITTSAYSGGIITINSVTGALVISVAAAAVVLNSITAVYTQSGTVYTHDTLDSLKADLVVTANYSDSSTQTVPAADYTLSGTLTAGTSTITVSYGGKTTTFSVTVTAGVPSGYTVYDYITIPNHISAAQPKETWIILKQYANLNVLSTEFVFKPITGHYDGSAVFGRRMANNATDSYAFYAKTGKLSWHAHGTASTTDALRPNTVENEINVVKYTNTSASPSRIQTNDNSPISITWANNDVLNLAPVLLNNPYGDTSFNLQELLQVGYIKFFDLSENLVGHYMPVVRTSDNRIGMYDIIEQVFYTTSTASYSTVGNANCYYVAGNWS